MDKCRLSGRRVSTSWRKRGGRTKERWVNDEPTKEKEILQNRSNNGWPVQQAHYITLKTRRSQAKKSHSEVKWGETTYLPRRLTSEVMETKTMPRNRVAILKKIGKLRLYMPLSESETMMRMMRHSLPGGIPSLFSLFYSATTSLSLLFKKGLVYVISRS